MLHPVLLGRAREAEPVVGSRREGQTEQAAEATSGAPPAEPRLSPGENQQTPPAHTGDEPGEEPPGPGAGCRPRHQSAN